MVNAEIAVEVAYASAAEQTIICLQVKPNCTVGEAITASGILQRFPEIDLDKQQVGIFSKKATLGTVLCAGDRVEIYQPLLIDPKQKRRER